MYNKIIVASDSFKGSLSSLDVAEAAAKAIHEIEPQCEVIKVDVADGGEGTMDALRRTLGGEKISVEVADPLGRPIQASYVILEDGTAVLEMAAASGLPLLLPSERNPLKTSTFGTGQLIADALKKGCRKFLVGIGGSATNDAGMGMLQALGVRFYDAAGAELQGRGESLEKVANIDMEGLCNGLMESEFIVACDVEAPLYGPTGAAYVFAPQKGADPAMVERLDNGLKHFSEVAFNSLHTTEDYAKSPGAGAAGGLGFGFIAFLSARLERGIEMVLDAIGFDQLIKGASLVITGEGRVDSQTLTGKTPFGVLKRAKKQGIPVVAIGGSVTLDPKEALEAGFAGVYAVTPAGMPLDTAMQPSVAAENICNTVRNILTHE
jgi:glycerate kinase